jgi:hypothetical protein
MFTHTNRFYFTTMLCFSLTIHAQSQGNPLKFIQGENTYVISQDIDSITLNREPFAMRYFCKPYNGKKQKFYAAQVAVLTNRADLRSFHVGSSMEDNPFFAPGTGMAPGESGLYENIFIGDSGHHYLFYESEKGKRVTLIAKTKKFLELEWNVRGVFEGKDMTFSKFPRSVLYFAIFIDGNLNNTIDENEFQVVKVNFK